MGDFVCVVVIVVVVVPDLSILAFSLGIPVKVSRLKQQTAKGIPRRCKTYMKTLE